MELKIRGMTLVELLVCVGVVGIAVATLGQATFSAFRRVRIEREQMELLELRAYVRAFHSCSQTFPLDILPLSCYSNSAITTKQPDGKIFVPDTGIQVGQKFMLRAKCNEGIVNYEYAHLSDSTLTWETLFKKIPLACSSNPCLNPNRSSLYFNSLHFSNPGPCQNFSGCAQENTHSNCYNKQVEQFFVPFDTLRICHFNILSSGGLYYDDNIHFTLNDIWLAGHPAYGADGTLVTPSTLTSYYSMDAFTLLPPAYYLPSAKFDPNKLMCKWAPWAGTPFPTIPSNKRCLNSVLCEIPNSEVFGTFKFSLTPFFLARYRNLLPFYLPLRFGVTTVANCNAPTDCSHTPTDFLLDIKYLR